MKKVKVAWYDRNGDLIQTFSGLTEMYKKTGIVPSAIYRSNLYGHYLDSNKTFCKYFDSEPIRHIEPPTHAKRGPKEKISVQKQNLAINHSIELTDSVVDERNENIKVLKTAMKSVDKILDELNSDRSNQIRSMINKIQNESIMFGIKSERFGKGEELEQKIYEIRRKI